MRFRHVEPDITYKDKAIDFVNEFKNSDSKIYGGNDIFRYIEYSSYEKWLRLIELQRNKKSDGETVPNETYFFVDEEDNIIGIINIRLGLNDMLRNIGGHIGYSIRPSQRGKGYNKINLYLGLKRLNEVGEKEALLDCEITNKASSGTMKALGGKLIKTKNTERHGIVEDYIIDIESSLEKYQDQYNQYIISNSEQEKVNKL